MTAVPARVAGVARDRAVRAAGRATGGCPTVTLAAAAIAGVDEVYRDRRRPGDRAPWPTAPSRSRPVDVIVGPGNVYVAVAKREVAGEGRVGVPSAFAGPSEVVVVADDSVDTDLVPRSTSSCRPSTGRAGWPG